MATKKRLLPLLMAVLMVFAMMPMNSFAADTSTSNGRSIVLGSEKISEGNTICFGLRSGAYQQMESAWRVLHASGRTALLITQYALDEIQYSTVEKRKNWQDSNAQTWCTSLYNRWVNAADR